MFQSSYIEEEIDRLALNSKHQMTSAANPNSNPNVTQPTSSSNINNNNQSMLHNTAINLRVYLTI